MGARLLTTDVTPTFNCLFLVSVTHNVGTAGLGLALLLRVSFVIGSRALRFTPFTIYYFFLSIYGFRYDSWSYWEIIRFPLRMGLRRREWINRNDFVGKLKSAELDFFLLRNHFPADPDNPKSMGIDVNYYPSGYRAHHIPGFS